MTKLQRTLLALTLAAPLVACSGGDGAMGVSESDGSASDSASGADATSPGDASSTGDSTAPPDGASDATATADGDARASADGGTGDADAGGSIDGSPPTDTGAGDTGSADTGSGDTGSADAGSDTGTVADAGANDAGEDATLDASSGDAAAPVDASGNDAGADDASDASTVPPVDASDGGAPVDAGPPRDAGTIDFVSGVVVSTLAGSDVAGSADGTGAAAQFNDPTGMAIDPQGNLLVTDYTGSLVRRVTPQGVVTTLARGTTFVGPFAAVVATDGTYYVETDFNSAGVKNDSSGTIWRVDPLLDGGVATPSLSAQGFGRPRGLAAIAGGDLFIADRLREIVETFDTAHGTLTFLAGGGGDGGFQDGTGAGAQFDSPIGAVALADGSVLVADTNNNRIRRVEASGAVTTFAGDGAPGVNDGPRLGAEFDSPRDVAVDLAGNVYVSDAGNHRIRRIRVDGNVDTLAGDGSAGFRDGAGAQAEFYGQEGIDVTPDGKIVYLADGDSGDGSPYHRVRALALP